MNGESNRMGFYVVTENSFHASYLVSQWYHAFRDKPQFRGIVIRGGCQQEWEARIQFHKEHQQQKQLTEQSFRTLESLYGEISKAEQAMLKRYGIPELPMQISDALTMHDENLNSSQVESWLEQVTATDSDCYFFVFLDKMLAPWWIEKTNGRVINGHSAVLPYARGFYAVETMAARGNLQEFRNAAGASVHYIKEGIDDGPIILSRRLRDPFACESIWDVKACCYQLTFSTLQDTAHLVLNNQEGNPIGNDVDPKNLGPIFYRKDFTSQQALRAETMFLELKRSSGSPAYTR